MTTRAPRAKRPPSRIDDVSLSTFAAMFGARLGYPVPDSILAFTRAELEGDGMTTYEFETAASRLLRGKLYAAFPGVDEFWSALAEEPAANPYGSVPGPDATMRRLDAEARERRTLLASTGRAAALDRFHALWTAELAHCRPADRDPDGSRPLTPALAEAKRALLARAVEAWHPEGRATPPAAEPAP